MKSNIVYQYFKKESKEGNIYIQFDPIRMEGSRLSIIKGELEIEEIEFDGDSVEGLKEEGYSVANALEYHLILKGLA